MRCQEKFATERTLIFFFPTNRNDLIPKTIEILELVYSQIFLDYRRCLEEEINNADRSTKYEVHIHLHKFYKT